MPAIATETLPQRMELMAVLRSGSGYFGYPSSRISPIYTYTVLPNFSSSSLFNNININNISSSNSNSNNSSSSSSSGISSSGLSSSGISSIIASSPQNGSLQSNNNSGSSSITSVSNCDEPDNKSSNDLPLPLFAKHLYRMNDIFHREDERVKTFDQWPLGWLNKYELARTGMFYTGEEDKVKCYFCEVEIGRWEEHDLPVPEHLRWSPNCPLLRRRTTNNVPIDIEALDRVLPAVSYDLCGANDAIEVRPFAYAEGTINMPRPMNGGSYPPFSAATAAANAAASTSCMPATQNYFPEYPEYAIEAARLRSFAEWPRLMKQRPEQLSEAGFFYTGVGDRVKCFSCGGGLKDWDEHDEPWEQHALWLSKCRYLNLMKGQTYIEAVLAKYKTPEGETAKSQPGDELPKPNESDVAAAATTIAPATTAAATAISAAAAAPTPSCDVTPTAERSTDCLSTSAADKQTPPATNSSIPEEKLCKICYADEYNTAFLPCGHVVACAKCASSVTKCPLCRKPFTDVMRVYFS